MWDTRPEIQHLLLGRSSPSRLIKGSAIGEQPGLVATDPGLRSETWGTLLNFPWGLAARFAVVFCWLVTEGLLSMTAASSVWPMSRVILSSAAMFLWLAVGYAQEVPRAEAAAPAAQTFPLANTQDLVGDGVKAEAVEYLGRKAVRLTTVSEDGDGMALVKGTNFRDGTIGVDVATKITRPPGVRMPGFIGIAFRAHPEASRYELFYLRPGNSTSDDQAMRNHSVQYSSEPNFGWEMLRRRWPFIYQAYADLQLDAWTKVKIEVRGRVAKLYVNGSEKPSLVVDGLKGEDLQGSIALWSYAGEEAYFSKLRISNTKPEPVENGGDDEAGSPEQ
jgi:hypothetical protein